MNHIDVMKQALSDMKQISENMKSWAAYASGVSQKRDTVIANNAAEADEAVERLSKAIEEAEKNQFNPDWNAINLLSEATFALHKRIAELEAEKAEPVGQLQEDLYGRGSVFWFNKPKNQSLLYTALPKSEWAGLTEEEIRDIHWSKPMDEYGYANAIEAKLKEKNHIASVGNMVAIEKENAELKKQLEQTAMALREQVQLNKYLEKRLSANT